MARLREQMVAVMAEVDSCLLARGGLIEFQVILKRIEGEKDECTGKEVMASHLGRTSS